MSLHSKTSLSCSSRSHSLIYPNVSCLSRIQKAIHGHVAFPFHAPLSPLPSHSEIAPLFCPLQSIPWFTFYARLIAAAALSPYLSILSFTALIASLSTSLIESTLTRDHVGKQLHSPPFPLLPTSNHLRCGEALLIIIFIIIHSLRTQTDCPPSYPSI